MSYFKQLLPKQFLRNLNLNAQVFPGSLAFIHHMANSIRKQILLAGFICSSKRGLLTTHTHHHSLFDKPEQHQQLGETAHLTALLCKF